MNPLPVIPRTLDLERLLEKNRISPLAHVKPERAFSLLTV
jgi:hypothetical protein